MALRSFLALSLCAASALGVACCVVHAGGDSVHLADERVIIVWNEKAKTQHFIRQAKFDTKAEDFGFIVPTPTKPELELADAKAFDQLEGHIQQEMAPKDADSAAGAATTEVEVLETKRVGDYDATILRADDARALGAWLKKNGFSSRPAMEAWLGHYIKKDWIFTAFKFIRSAPTGTMTQAIRLSFRTEKPHYPYKMPDDTWPEGHVRPIQLYFIADGEIEAEYVDQSADWEAEKRWSGKLPAHLLREVAEDLKLTPAHFPTGAVLTAFNNEVNEKGYSHDLAFERRAMSVWVYVLAALIGGAIAWTASNKLRARYSPDEEPFP